MSLPEIARFGMGAARRGKRLAIEAEEALETTVYVAVRKERCLNGYLAVQRHTMFQGQVTSRISYAFHKNLGIAEDAAAVLQNLSWR
jgi:hypothetical protein